MGLSAEHPKSLDVYAAQAAPRCVLVVARRTPLWDSSSALRVDAARRLATTAIHLNDAYCQGTSNARQWRSRVGLLTRAERSETPLTQTKHVGAALRIWIEDWPTAVWYG